MFQVGDEVSVHVSSFVYRLRMALALLAEYHDTFYVSRETRYIEALLKDLLEAGESAATAIRRYEAEGTTPPEAYLGQAGDPL